MKHRFLTLDELKRAHVEIVLMAVGGNVSEAARALDIARSTLQRYLRRTSSIDVHALRPRT